MNKYLEIFINLNNVGFDQILLSNHYSFRIKLFIPVVLETYGWKFDAMVREITEIRIVPVIR